MYVCARVGIYLYASQNHLSVKSATIYVIT